MGSSDDYLFDILKPNLEALIFTSSVPLTLSDLEKCVNTYLNLSLGVDEIRAMLERLGAFYDTDGVGFRLMEFAGGYQFMVDKRRQPIVNLLIQQTSRRKLSQGSIETLAIVAYKQPITKAEVEYIRGVNCDYAVQKLLDRNLLAIKGKSTAPGRPILYGTSDYFMDYFAINDLKDLPQIKELQPGDVETQSEIGVGLGE